MNVKSVILFRLIRRQWVKAPVGRLELEAGRAPLFINRIFYLHKYLELERGTVEIEIYNVCNAVTPPAAGDLPKIFQKKRHM